MIGRQDGTPATRSVGHLRSLCAKYLYLCTVVHACPSAAGRLEDLVFVLESGVPSGRSGGACHVLCRHRDSRVHQCEHAGLQNRSILDFMLG